MIVYKNKLEESNKSHNDHIQFKVNGTHMDLTKNYSKIQNIILSQATKNENQKHQQMIEIMIPDLTTFYTIKYKEDIFNNFNDQMIFNSKVLYSNFDGRTDDNDSKDRGLFELFKDLLNHITQNEDIYYTNEIKNLSQINIFSLESDKRRAVQDSIISLKQFQLLLDGYDIIVPDFIIDDMIKIAEKFEIEDLIEELKIFKNEIEDILNYNRFSELEILIKFNEILKEIDENNFHKKISLIYSIFEYIGNDLFELILNHFISLYPQKGSVYSKICKMVNSKFHENQIKFEKIKIKKPKKDDLGLYDIISNDDIDSLQKQLCNPALDISKISFVLKYMKCNLIECAAFFGSIKCFKYLLSNTELDTSRASKFAIIGGNIEIIRICQQKNYYFNESLKVAIKYHQNIIGKWIFENKIDENIDLQSCIYKCIDEHNYEMLQYFLDKESLEISKEKQIVIKYILYALQYYHLDVCDFSSFEYFISKYKCIKYKNDSGLIYCPIGKIKIFEIAINQVMNDYHNERVLKQPFLLAAYKNDLEMFKFLFELKDSHLLQSKNGYGFNLTKMMKDFFNGVNNIEAQYCYILANSIYSGGIDIINYLVDTNKIDINMNFKGLNLLHMAAILNNVEMGKFLIEKIDINILDNQKHTPLMYAIKNHSIEFINFLLNQSKTDINCQDILSFFSLANFVFLYNIFMLFETCFCLMEFKNNFCI